MQRLNIIQWLLTVLTFGGVSSRVKAAPSNAGGGMMPMPMMSSGRGQMEMGRMMGSADQADMRIYMDMFDHHREIRRTVQQIHNGIRTVTESSNPRITGLLQAHVEKMYDHVAKGQEVRCMSDSLPTMFRHAARYRRHFTLTPHGVAIEETSDDPVVLAAIRRHAEEVSGFVREGMSAMMKGMMP